MPPLRPLPLRLELELELLALVDRFRRPEEDALSPLRERAGVDFADFFEELREARFCVAILNLLFTESHTCNPWAVLH